MSDESWPARCSSCGNPQIAAILYGLPMFDAKLERDLVAGRIVLGGCIIWEGMPKWCCVRCQHQWGRIELPKIEEPGT